ncbi:MAG: polysaccharide biosynthesis/export family protein [Bryobacteraceae bacterium]
MLIQISRLRVAAVVFVAACLVPGITSIGVAPLRAAQDKSPEDKPAQDRAEDKAKTEVKAPETKVVEDKAENKKEQKADGKESAESKDAPAPAVVKAPETPAETAAPAEGGAATAPPAPAEGAEPKPTQDAKVDPRAYVIGAEDVLFVHVWSDADLTKRVIVRPDGKVTIPLLNDVHAAGLTPEALGMAIRDGLSKFMTKPWVSVTVEQVHSKKYFISGEVQRPGSYPLLIPTTVLEALVNAGGFRDFANQKKIVVMRTKERMKFNYKEVIDGKKMEQNITLQPGDHIIVP